MGDGLTVTVMVAVCAAASRTVSVTTVSTETVDALSVTALPATAWVTGNTAVSEEKTWNGPTPLLILICDVAPE